VGTVEGGILMLNKIETQMKNCPLCGSDNFGIISVIDVSQKNYQKVEANIRCFCCGTSFFVSGKTMQDIFDLWNDGKIPQE
jgi:transcription elongation factor Elf1